MDERVKQLLDLPLEGNYNLATSVFEELRKEARQRLADEIEARYMSKQEFANYIDYPISKVYHSLQEGYPFRGTYDYIIKVAHDFMSTSCHEFLFGSEEVCILPPEEAVLAYLLEKMSGENLNKALSCANDSMKAAEQDGSILTNRSENYCIYYRGNQLAKQLCIPPIYLTGKDTIRTFRRILRFLIEPYNGDYDNERALLNYNTLMYLTLFTQKTIDFYIDWNFVEHNKVGYFPIVYYDRSYKFTHEIEQINEITFLSKLDEESEPTFYCRSLDDFRKKFDFSPDLKDPSPKDPLQKFLPVVMTYHHATNQEPHIISSWKVLVIIQTLMVLDENHRSALCKKLYALYLDQLLS